MKEGLTVGRSLPTPAIVSRGRAGVKRGWARRAKSKSSVTGAYLLLP